MEKKQVIEAEVIKEEPKKMGVLERLANVRAELSTNGIGKGGKNSYSGYGYYQLEDFLPSLVQLEKKWGIVDIFNISQQMDVEGKPMKLAMMTFYNTDDWNDHITFNVDFVDAVVKGASAIQNYGATITYLKRYLYMMALDIAENDTVEENAGKPDPETGEVKAEPKKKVLISPEQIEYIYSLYTTDEITALEKRAGAKVEKWDAVTASKAIKFKQKGKKDV